MKSKNKTLIEVIVFLIVIILALISFIIINREKINKNNAELDNKTNETKEVDPIYYEDLMSDLMYKDSGYYYELLDKNYTIDTLTNNYMLNTIAQKYYQTQNETFQIDKSIATELGMSEDIVGKYLPGVSSKSMKKGLKKVFNKEISLPSEIKGMKFILSLDAYLPINSSGGPGTANAGFVTYKAEKNSDKLYLYNKFYIESSNYLSEGIYDYNKIKITLNESGIYEISENDAKSLINSGSINEIENNIKQNLDKFTTYKFTFKLVDGNYIYQKYEKE